MTTPLLPPPPIAPAGRAPLTMPGTHRVVLPVLLMVFGPIVAFFVLLHVGGVVASGDTHVVPYGSQQSFELQPGTYSLYAPKGSFTNYSFSGPDGEVKASLYGVDTRLGLLKDGRSYKPDGNFTVTQPGTYTLSVPVSTVHGPNDLAFAVGPTNDVLGSRALKWLFFTLTLMMVIFVCGLVATVLAAVERGRVTKAQQAARWAMRPYHVMVPATTFGASNPWLEPR